MTQGQEVLAETKVRLHKDGRFVIPVAFRKALGLKVGDEVVMSWKEDALFIKRASRSKAKKRRRASR